MNQEQTRKKQGARLKRVRIAAGFDSSRGAALEAGWKESTYRAHEGGTRTLKPADAAKYVRYFEMKGAKGFSGKWVIYGDDDDLGDVSIDELVANDPDLRRKLLDIALDTKKR